MSDQPGFEIDDVFYPFVSSYRLCDPILVRDVTGMDWAEFAEKLDAGDPGARAGVVAVSIWQQHPKWSREKAVYFVQTLDVDKIVWSVTDEEVSGSPPASADIGDSTETSTPMSAEPDPSATTPDGIGLPLSETIAA